MFGAVAVILVAVVVPPVAARHDLRRPAAASLIVVALFQLALAAAFLLKRSPGGDVNGCGGGCRFGVGRLPGGGRSLYLGWPGNAVSGRAFPMCGAGPLRVRLVCDGYLARKGLP